MHWLPLVAMVIASALFFPLCPGVPRLVVATMEPGNNFSTRPLVNPISKSNDSDVEYMSSDKKAAEKLPYRTPDTHIQINLTVNNTSSLTNEDLMPERNQYQKARPDRIDLGFQTSSSLQERHNFQESHTLTSHTHMSTDGQFQEDNTLQMHTEGDGTKDNGLNRKNEEVQMKRLTFNEWPRDLHPADRPTNKEEDNEGTRENALPTLPAVSPEGMGLGLDGLLQVNDELLLLDSNPRVLFSTSPSPPKHPPLQVMLELGLMPEQQEEQETDNKLNLEKGEDGESYKNLLLNSSDSSEHATPFPRRKKRQLSHTGPEHSVCESTSHWVVNRRQAVDLYNNTVTVLAKFSTKMGLPVSQYFYETRCRGPNHSRVQAGQRGVAGAGCLGVDQDQWTSECQTKQSYVRAFTVENNKLGWRWIRIDTSCVCVLYKAPQKTRALTTRQGRRRV